MPRRQLFFSLYRQLHGHNPEDWEFNILSQEEQEDRIAYLREQIAVELNKLVSYGAGDWTTAKKWMRQAMAA